MLVLLITVCVSMSVSALCSILEACLLSLSTADIAKISERKPQVAEVWRRFRENIQKPIAVILIINTFAHTIGAALSGSQFNTLFGPKWIGVYSIVFSIVMIQWTEILPKTLAVRYNRAVAATTGIPFAFVTRLFAPILYLAELANRPFEDRKRKGNQANPLDDISVLAHYATLQKVISKEQESIVEKGIGLSNRTVDDILVRREDMKCLHTKMNLDEALIESHIHNHTRYPLVDSDSDEIIGYVNFKDIVSALKVNPVDPSLKGICRPVISVPIGASLSSLLSRLIKACQHIAIVKGNGLRTVGMVTIEDVTESIVGEIQDEYDILPEHFFPLTENRYVVGAGIPVARLRKTLVADWLPDTQTSLNEHLLALFGNKTPKAEESITQRNLKFIVKKVRRSNIYEIILEVS